MFKTEKIKFSTVINIVLISALIVVILNPKAKATFINGLIKIGLMNPKIQSTKSNTPVYPIAPNATFWDVNQQPMELADLKNKVVFINVWATWCPPCVAELPSIFELYQLYKSNPNIVFVLADADGKLAEANQFLEKKNISLPLYSFKENLPTELYKGNLPTTVIVDKVGQIRYQHVGAANYSSKKMVDFIGELLSE